MRQAILMLSATLTLSAQIPDVSGEPAMLAALRYIDVVKGSGAPALPGKKYVVHYTGWLKDGTKFDSSVDRHTPFDFVQGRRQVIAGWDSGFEGMRVGGRRRLLIPYQLAYGEKGSGKIPPRAELIFDVELLEVQDVPERLPAEDLLLPFSDSEKKVLGLARAVPADKYSWRPAAGVRSFGEVFLHIAYGNRLLLKIGAGELSGDALNAQIAAQMKAEVQPSTKDQILETLAQSFAEVRKDWETARAGTLAHDADFFGHKTTRRGVYTVLDTHIGEHLGQAIAYARMNGITPPWSAGAR